jgi:MoxR-like ATPase
MIKFLSFIPQYTRLEDVLKDQKLARLGDAYVNFIYSIALSKRKGEATGAKVSSSILAQALRRAELRDFLPRRMDRHALGDATEALLVYAWIHGAISIEESVTALLSSDNAAEAFATLLRRAKEKLSFDPTASAPTL